MSVIPSSQHAAQWYDTFCACQQKLIRHLARKVGNVEEARDLAQETWVRVAGTMGNTPVATPFSADAAQAYLFSIANHLAIDRLRRNRLHERYVDGMAGQAPALGHDVADQVLYQEAIAKVEGVIDAFPERMREVFTAHRLHGETQADIADRLGVSLNTVERDLMRVDEQLEAAMLRWHGHSPGEVRRLSGQRTAGRRRTLLGLLGLGGLAVLGPSFGYWWQQRLLGETLLASITGQMLSQELSDGSRVRLDADSRLAIRYYANRREALLERGAAFFAVVSDASRPFTVQAAGVRVTVLGTRFGVDLGPDAVTVQVESGRVGVTTQDGAEMLALEAGDELVVPLGGQAGAARRRVIERAAAWRQGELVFEHEPLGRVLDRLRRYTSRKLEVDRASAAFLLSGHIRIDQAGQWLRSLPQVAPVFYETTSDGVRISASPSQS